ncbi:MAG: ABC transporter permease [Anaerolineae bacterium]|jgi:peptide/nickel transport system permease protein|nr:ABC transporter permease [Anaerolineae bacterium]
MIKYLLRRLIQAIPIVFGVTVISYGLMAITPGGPVGALAFNSNLRAADRERLEQRLGVNDPLPVQYLRWLLGDDWMRWDTNDDGLADQAFLISLTDSEGNPLPPGDREGVLRGDFGTSFSQSGRAVLPYVTERIPASLELSISALIVGLVTGIVIGILAAVNQNGWFDQITRVLAVVFDAVPGFFLALLLLLIFASPRSPLSILPMADRCPPYDPMDFEATCPPIHERLDHLLLPTLVLATGGISTYSRYMRTTMLDVVSQDYMRTARSKGLSNRVVWFKHGARNALIPVATFLGPAIAGIWGGAVIIETIFNWPGVGLVATRALGARDYPVVMAVTLFGAVSTIIGYLLSDILYAVIDPRIRFD